MLRNSLDKLKRRDQGYRWQFLILLPLWVFVGFVTSHFLVTAVVMLLQRAGVLVQGEVNTTILNTIAAAVIYVLTLCLVVGVPWIVRQRRTTREDLGAARFPSWTDIGLAPVGFIVYYILSVILVAVAGLIIPAFDMQQVQDVGFSNLSQRYEMILAFLTLVIVAPLAEELLFRGYLYGKLRKSVPIWLAVLATSLLFAAIHGQWNVAVDVFALSLVMCGLREITGSIWAGVVLHTMKNGLAFYLLFINPSLLATIGA